MPLAQTYLTPAIAVVRSQLKELVPSCDSNLVQSQLRLITCLLEAEKLKGSDIEPLFIFALIW